MKVALHFNAGHTSLGNPYGPQIERLTFIRLLARRCPSVSSKVYMGDFPLFLLCPNEKTLVKTIDAWCKQTENVWRRLTDRIQLLAQVDSFVLCFESISRSLAAELHDALASEEAYLGAIEVDDASEVHWNLYSDTLALTYRITDESVAVFVDELSQDDPSDEEKDQEVKRLLNMGFKNVRFETCTGKHSFFDKFHNFKHARRIAEWRSQYSDLLGTIVDEVVCRLGDTAPDLGNRLWAALQSFQNAETDEQFAQVSATCRRIIEYVTDVLFPATTEVRDGRKLGETHYRNRLLAWVGDQTKSATTINVIASGLELFAEHVESLQNLANKGIHATVQRDGAKRCLLRTVFLLDDIISLRPESFPIRTEFDNSILSGD